MMENDNIIVNEKEKKENSEIGSGQKQEYTPEKEPLKFYKKRWVRITALVVAIVMLITTVYIAYGTSLSVQTAELQKAQAEKITEEELIRLQQLLQNSANQQTLENARARKDQKTENLGSQAQESDEEISSENQMVSLYDQALEKEDQQDFQGASDLYSRLLESKAYNNIYYVCRARCKFYLADYQGLIDDCTRYFTDHGKDKDGSIHYLMAVADMYLEQYVEATENLNACLEANDAMEDIYFYRGVCQMAQGLYQEAADDFANSISRGEMVEDSQTNQTLCLEQLKANGETTQ